MTDVNTVVKSPKTMMIVIIILVIMFIMFFIWDIVLSSQVSGLRSDVDRLRTDVNIVATKAGATLATKSASRSLYY